MVEYKKCGSGARSSFHTAWKFELVHGRDADLSSLLQSIMQGMPDSGTSPAAT